MKLFILQLLKKSNIEFSTVKITSNFIQFDKINHTKLNFEISVGQFSTHRFNGSKISPEEGKAQLIEANIKELELVDIAKKINEYYDNNQSLLSRKVKNFEYIKN